MLPERAASYLARRERARSDLEQRGLDALVVSHPPNIRYLTAFAGSAGVLLLGLQSAHLIVDSRYATVARTVVELGSAIADDLAVLVAPASIDDTLLATLRARNATQIGIEGNSISVARFNRLRAALAASTSPGDGAPATAPAIVPTERLVETHRVVKEPWEIATLREAGRRLAQVARQVPSVVRQGRTELEVAAEIDFMIRTAGFERAAFETIVASGPNSALPHARPGARRLEEDEGVVLDFGGVYDGYSVDLSRTVELGRARPEWRRLVAAVSAAQGAAIAAVRPGVLASVVDAAARELLTQQGLGAAFAHATGHGLGLEVHEEPRIGRRTEGQTDVVLEPGMVFTVEPGAYVEGLGGVRLEDDVLVTSAGCEVLTL